MAPGRTAIASRRLLAVDNKGQEFDIAVAVGEPYEVEADIVWACPASIEGLHGRFPDLQGVDSRQALQLAHQIIAEMLAHFVSQGGRLFWPQTREAVSLEEMFPKLKIP